MSEKILSPNNPRIKELASLKKSGGGLFLVEGFHLVEMAFLSGSLVEVLAVDDPHLKGAKTTLVSEAIIKKLSFSQSPEPIIGVCKKGNKEAKRHNRALLLDRVQDPGNVGTLLRTALAFSFDEVLSIQGTASFYGNKVVAASQGAIFSLSLKEGLSEEEALSYLKGQGYFLFGSALEGGEDFRSLEIVSPVCLILGNEGKGMSESLKKEASSLAYIPISGIDSLNVSVSGGILMESINHALANR